jgi:hypothetical protein
MKELVIMARTNIIAQLASAQQMSAGIPAVATPVTTEPKSSPVDGPSGGTKNNVAVSNGSSRVITSVNSPFQEVELT